MLRSVYVTVAFAFPLLFVCTSAGAVNLSQVYTQAEASDPLYKEAMAAYQATLETKPQARSQLLPLVTLSANTTNNNQDISTNTVQGNVGQIEFNSHGYSLDITQPVFRYDRYLALKQADSQILQAQAELDAAHQDLIVRVAERYFDVLAAMDSLEFARAGKTSLNRQLDQAKQLFEVGLIAITDVQETQAGYDRAVAGVILAENDLDDAREALRELTGDYETELNPLGEDMPLVSPQPEVIEDWTKTSEAQNFEVIAAQHALETAQQDIKIQQAGHLPTLDIVANKGFDTNGGRFGATDIHADAIRLELNVPLYQGGVVNSRTRQARDLYDQAYERLEQAHRTAQRQTREAFLGVISGISQVQALKQSVISSETALQSTEAGFEVGTRTAVDVVAAERTTFQTKRDYSRARYDYILNTLRLKQAAGTLSPDDLHEINTWLN